MHPTTDWQCSSPGLIVGSQLAPLDGPDDAWTASAKTTGSLHGATEQPYRVERWRARRGPLETGGRPNPERTCRRQEMTADCAYLVAVQAGIYCCAGTGPYGAIYRHVQRVPAATEAGEL